MSMRLEYFICDVTEDNLSHRYSHIRISNILIQGFGIYLCSKFDGK